MNCGVGREGQKSSRACCWRVPDHKLEWHSTLGFSSVVFGCSIQEQLTAPRKIDIDLRNGNYSHDKSFWRLTISTSLWLPLQHVLMVNLFYVVSAICCLEAFICYYCSEKELVLSSLEHDSASNAEYEDMQPSDEAKTCPPLSTLC